jgi:hypothetical protein
MTDTRAAAPGAAATGLAGFLIDALAALRTPALILPAALLAVLLTATNILLVLNMPDSRAELPPFLAIAAVRVLGLLWLAVALLRVINRSPRGAWAPDGALWLYGATFLLGLGVTAAMTQLLGGRSDAVAGLIIATTVSLATAPFAAWFTAIAVERPLAWRAGRWLRDFGRWLPHLLLWSLLLVIPLGQLHAAIGELLVSGADRWFWPLALLDGPLSLLLALLGLALASAAYRSVARG